MSDSDLYTIGEVAAILGVSAHTIRAWERRHGIVNPQRTRARQRRYRGEDVELLRDVKKAIDLHGLSLKLAFQTVTRGTQAIETPVRRPRGKQAGQWPLPGEEGVWHAVADVLPQLIIIVDSNGKIVEANVVTAKTFDVVRQQLQGRAFADLVDPFDRAKAVLLYRPRPRTVKGWELNLRTRNGPRLYSFQSWPVRQGNESSLALVGSEMFEDPPASPEGAGAELLAAQPSIPGPNIEVSVREAFQSLVDQLPVGVAVTTIGPEPRVVYGNQRLAETLHLGTAMLTGKPLSELLPGAGVLDAHRQAVTSRSARAFRGDVGGSFDLGFQPLFSSNHRVASVLVVVEEERVEVAERRELERLVADRRFERARTVLQLGRVALDHLEALAPRGEFVLALAQPVGQPGQMTYFRSPNGRRTVDPSAIPGPFDQAIRSVAQTGATTEDLTSAGDRLTAVPLSPGRRLGVLAWRQPADAPPDPEQRNAIEAFVARLAVAAELLHVRIEAARKAFRLEAVTSTASVVQDTARGTALSVKFLERLCQAVKADGASVGRVEGKDFVVETAYAPGGAHARPGDRFPLSGRFVSRSVATGLPASTTAPSSPGLPRRVRQALAPMKHALSVPLFLKGRVAHVVTLLRTSNRPFTEEDALIVQTLSGVALMAITLGQKEPGRGAIAGGGRR